MVYNLRIQGKAIIDVVVVVVKIWNVFAQAAVVSVNQWQTRWMMTVWYEDQEGWGNETDENEE